MLVRDLNTFLLCLDAMEEQQLSVIFRSALSHFENGGNTATLFWMGRRDVPGVWVDKGNVARVNCFVCSISFQSAMTKYNFSRYLCNWLKKQRIPEQMVDTIARQSRVFTTWEAEAMGLRCEMPVEVDAETRSDFERLRQITQPKDEGQSRELRHLLGKCTEWMEENDLPDEMFELPPDELFEAVTQ